MAGSNDVKGLPYKWDKMKKKSDVPCDKGKLKKSKNTGGIETITSSKDNTRPFTWG